MRTSFPDWYSTLEELVAEGNMVAERWAGRGTHQGEFQGISATGRRVAVHGTVFYRIAEGRIVEFRGQFDRMSMMEHLASYLRQAKLEPFSRGSRPAVVPQSSVTT